ncbi:MAG: nitronate monooxygenase, partial [Actinomycetota bacterium]
MANNQPPGFAALACDAGALGTIAAGYWSPEQLRDELARMGDRRFGVNVFAPPYLHEGVLDAVLEARPAVLSFAFGVLDPAPLQAPGIEVWGPATSADEAPALRDAGVDAVIAQGAEAGGHRGSFLAGFPLVPVDELPESIHVDVPAYAAGGIVDRHD